MERARCHWRCLWGIRQFESPEGVGQVQRPGPLHGRTVLNRQNPCEMFALHAIALSPRATNGYAIPLSILSGWRDLNSRPSDPQPDALPNCATARVTKPRLPDLLYGLRAIVQQICTHP